MAEKFPKEIYLQGNLRLDKETTKRKDARFHDKIYKDPGPTQRPNNSIPLTEFIQEKIDNEELILPESDCDCDTDLTCEKTILIPGEKYVTIPEQSDENYAYVEISEVGINPGDAKFITDDGGDILVMVSFNYFNLDGTNTYSQQSDVLPSDSTFTQIRTLVVDTLIPNALTTLPPNNITAYNTSFSRPGFYVRGEGNDIFTFTLTVASDTGSFFSEDLRWNFSRSTGGNFDGHKSSISGGTSFYQLSFDLITKFSLELVKDSGTEIIPYYDVIPGTLNLDEDTTEVKRVFRTLTNPQTSLSFDTLEIHEQEGETIIEEVSICETLTNHEERITELEENGGGEVSASNGIYDDEGTIKLGGDLTEDTDIPNPDNKSFKIGNPGDAINLNVDIPVEYQGIANTFSGLDYQSDNLKAVMGLIKGVTFPGLDLYDSDIIGTFTVHGDPFDTSNPDGLIFLDGIWYDDIAQEAGQQKAVIAFDSNGMHLTAHMQIDREQLSIIAGDNAEQISVIRGDNGRQTQGINGDNAEQNQEIQGDYAKQYQFIQGNGGNQRQSIAGDGAWQDKEISGDNGRQNQGITGYGGYQNQFIDGDGGNQHQNISGDYGWQDQNISGDSGRQHQGIQGYGSEQKLFIIGDNGEQKQLITGDSGYQFQNIAGYNAKQISLIEGENAEQKQIIEGDSALQYQFIEGNYGLQRQNITGDSGEQYHIVSGDSGRQHQEITGYGGYQSQLITGDSAVQDQSIEGYDAEQKQLIEGDSASQRQLITGDNSVQYQIIEGFNGYQRQSIEGDSAVQDQFIIGYGAEQRLYITGDSAKQHLYITGDYGIQTIILTGDYGNQESSVNGNNNTQVYNIIGNNNERSFKIDGDSNIQETLIVGTNNSMSRSVINTSNNKSFIENIDDSSHITTLSGDYDYSAESFFFRGSNGIRQIIGTTQAITAGTGFTVRQGANTIKHQLATNGDFYFGRDGAYRAINYEASGNKLGFFGADAVAQQIVPLGSTSDDIIQALQNLGLFRES